MPRISDRKPRSEWEEEGGEDVEKRAIAEAKRILAEHEVEQKSDEVLKEIEQIIANYK